MSNPVASGPGSYVADDLQAALEQAGAFTIRREQMLGRAVEAQRRGVVDPGEVLTSPIDGQPLTSPLGPRVLRK